ncbi:alpha/beta hydrolase fold-domain-containing protein [Chaetomidium leptoderma]|uniref:Alpha/beta hydrolase fold-domain-containing protein n=1 Tax=Chaetomidium leptoderma TaxID=669021 RepID=A0AAN6VN54_9PEZI|nr:alpha/beta hydrolase fold-domain-containing protein [Chaetomidium leptoderma]
MLFALLTKVPLMVRVALLHMLRLSQQSKYLDLRTELTVSVIRSIATPSTPKTITATQKMAAKAPKLKGKIWVSTYACPLPPAGETGLQDAIAAAIDGLRDPQFAPPTYQMSDPASVEAEWTGYRADATSDSRLPDVSQEELYGELMKEVKTPVTVLYFHGGAYYMMDPATHRPTTKTLAKLTGGRVYSVRYRLAPQHPFPAALMDALMSYLALLYPPEGAFHEPVKPEHIVFAGDSAGGHLALCLLQLLLHLRQKAHHIPWHGTARPLPLPAGVAVHSPWFDIFHTSPSTKTNAPFDYLPTLHQQLASEAVRPPCQAWPATPPRKHLFAADDLLTHPLVSLILARSWAGAPPVYVCTGWELLADEDKYVAHKMWREGVRVVLEEFEAMPHCFGLLFPGLAEARRCLEGWAGFLRGVVVGDGDDHDNDDGSNKEGKEKGGSRFVTVRAKTLEEVRIEPGELWTESEEVVLGRVWKGARERGVLLGEGVAKL